MASVPLHCHICPKQPTFSDISHLLTHVGSKGHLSHYFKAQVRAPQNTSIRQQLDTYEQWYKDYHIEKLLSQRMILKDSKKANGVSRATKTERSASTKSSKIPKASSQKREQAKTLQPQPGAITDNVIDPQLSQLSSAPIQQAAARKPSPTSSSPGLDLTSMYQAPVPRMRRFHPYAPTAGPRRDMLPSSVAPAAPEGERDGSDTESEDDVFGRRDSAKMVYPEPPSAEILPNFLHHEDDGQPTPRGRARRGQRNKEEDLGREEEVMPRTPELKGICYPGMSLFDSASPDAQRKRNQRKDESLIAQIEQESLEVECNEYIYWPDGALKMCRFITGDVQSSPPKEDTPPPPLPPKARRGRKPKGAIANPTKRKPRKAREAQVPEEQRPGPLKCETLSSEEAEWPKDSPALRDTTPKVFGHSRAHGQIEEEEDGWLLNMGEPTRTRRAMTPLSLHEEYSLPDQLGDPFEPFPNTLPPAFRGKYPQIMDKRVVHAGEIRGQADVLPEPAVDRLVLNPGKQTPEPSAKHEMLAATPRQLVAKSDKENFPFVGQAAWAGPSHRYFVVKGNHEPQFTATLPKEMAFAGMAAPPVYRVSLNPLNPNAHLRQSLPYSGNYTNFRMPPLQPNRMEEAEVLGRRFIVEDEVSKD